MQELGNMADRPESGGDATPTSPSNTKSILAGPSSPNSQARRPSQRLDAHGNAIEHKKKTSSPANKLKHKISFVDEVQPKAQVEEVKEVRAYKNSPYGGVNDHDDQPNCGCTLL